ncbi:predicted protein [Histoplasma capsulatum G186AR]|uniref:Uncharacterized protein n=1 Tax=Ajellomyces capsulatus (strain G186AR / H82 / ATCC MYA-2454 / RMSCC 2432) TaxID=447093 RepID=C0NC25_AJECG|nr:uncharacterized protein HCBG_00671 [Histoplasma capsulatum G186AR]EEH11216.1 predicted protein [Histoplasma capsulatum G186AR]
MTGSSIGKRGLAQMFAKAGFYSASQEVVEMITSENKVTGNTSKEPQRGNPRQAGTAVAFAAGHAAELTWAAGSGSGGGKLFRWVLKPLSLLLMLCGRETHG